MFDASSQWLLNTIRQTGDCRGLWLADENTLPLLQTLPESLNNLVIISNRFDVAEAAKNRSQTVLFNDFDAKTIESNSMDYVFYRISKEKPLVNHLLKTAGRVLKPGGTLVLCGEKNEGIKTIIDKAASYFSVNAKAIKQGTFYYAFVERQALNKLAIPDDNEYSTLRPVDLNGVSWLSKPGIFGWNKIDEGSALLVEQVLGFYQQLPPPERLLDLGCGYGYLTLASSALPVQTRVLTDNNAAALMAADANCKQQQLAAQVVAADAGIQLTGNFDLILCNPPFHQGFDTDGDLTDKFLQQAHRLLCASGNAFFVVNQFIPVERKAAPYFRQIEKLTRQRGFQVFRLAK
jgi:16S rRNA (guanine1207-N2)-methyltransferase